tara:strand:+ start:296 stop:592 length:297 start_codon:yes stop_codon:yes gene_type:complete
MALSKIKTKSLEDSAVTSAKSSGIETTLTYSQSTGTGDGSTTTLTIASGRSVSDVIVDVNGVIMTPTADYTISGTTLTFATAPAASAEITVRLLPINS